ncbi:MAG TPA: hypothetical protein VIQ03_15290 [Gammaproteobacteria bacterium]
MAYIKHSLLLTTFIFASMAVAATPEDDDFVFPDDDLEQRIAAVNEGPLHFMETAANDNVLRSENFITITTGSLSDGWVKLQQCYQNLDPIGKTEIIYHYKSMKDLRIVSFSNISSAKVVNQSVQLEDIEPGARLCVSADIRNFYKQSDNTYSLISGPYHRKFFDGYYPLNVYLEITYPKDWLSVITVTPIAQTGFTLNLEQHRIRIDALFEGKLTTEIKFAVVDK